MPTTPITTTSTHNTPTSTPITSTPTQHPPTPTQHPPTPTQQLSPTCALPTPTPAVIAKPNKPIVQQFHLETILKVSNTVAEYYPVEE